MAVLLASAAAAQTPVAGAFRGERFAEDWSAMRDPDQRVRPWHGLKALPLGDSGQLTLGGDARWRVETIDAPEFGATGADADSYGLLRLLLHADARPTSNVRGFVQLGYHEGVGRRRFFPLDDGGLDLQQAFVDITRGPPSDAVGLRVGRQEIVFSPRFVNPREAVNIRSAYDGVRGWATSGPWRVDAFASRPVLNGPGDFDDRRDRRTTFDGVRLQRTFAQPASGRAIISIYRQERDMTRVGALVGAEDRVSWGGRLAGAAAGWDLDAEHYQQTGSLAGIEIDAWGGGGDLGWTAKTAPWSPRLGVRWLYGSGDRDASDRESNTFVGPYARPPCCADPLWLAPANLLAVAPVLSAKPHPTLALEGKIDVIRRLEQADALYAVPLAAYPGTAGRPGDDAVSLAPTLSLTWTPTDEIVVQAAHVRQTADGVLGASGAEDASYTWASLALRF